MFDEALGIFDGALEHFVDVEVDDVHSLLGNALLLLFLFAQAVIEVINIPLDLFLAQNLAGELSEGQGPVDNGADVTVVHLATLRYGRYTGKLFLFFSDGVQMVFDVFKLEFAWVLLESLHLLGQFADVLKVKLNIFLSNSLDVSEHADEVLNNVVPFWDIFALKFSVHCLDQVCVDSGEGLDNCLT